MTALSLKMVGMSLDPTQNREPSPYLGQTGRRFHLIKLNRANTGESLNA